MHDEARDDEWKTLQQYFREASTQFSQIVRQMTLGAIGLAWIFAKENAGRTSIPVLFGAASALLLLGVIIDAGQYYYTSWTIDRILKADDIPEIPADQMKTMHTFFHAKFVVGATGIGLLVIALLKELLGQLTM